MTRLHEWSIIYLAAVAISSSRYYHIFNPKCWFALLVFMVG